MARRSARPWLPVLRWPNLLWPFRTLRRSVFVLLVVSFSITLLLVLAGQAVFVAQTERQFWRERQELAAKNIRSQILGFVRAAREDLFAIGLLNQTAMRADPSVLEDLLWAKPYILEVI